MRHFFQQLVSDGQSSHITHCWVTTGTLVSNEEDGGGAKMWVLVSQKICTPKTFTGFGSISISRCQDFVTFFTEKTGPPYLSKYAESVISYPPKHTNVQPWNSSKH